MTRCGAVAWARVTAERARKQTAEAHAESARCGEALQELQCRIESVAHSCATQVQVRRPPGALPPRLRFGNTNRLQLAAKARSLSSSAVEGHLDCVKSGLSF